MSIKEQDLAPQTTTTEKVSPRASMRLKDGSEIELFVEEGQGGRGLAWATWRGERWTAEHEDDNVALRMLIDRLHREDPFYTD
jgi:hypothetical protein